LTQAQLFLNVPLMYLKGAGLARAALLGKELNIFTCFDLLQHYPFRYVDRSAIHTIRDLEISSSNYVQIKARLIAKNVVGLTGSRRLVILARDESGHIDLIWFKGINWLEKNLKLNTEYIIFGKPNTFNGALNIVHPEIELASEKSLSAFTRLQPVYSTTERLKKAGLDSKGLQKLIGQLTGDPSFSVPENVPEAILTNYQLAERTSSFVIIHAPTTPSALEAAIQRLKFEELFLLQIKLLRQKGQRREKSQGYIFNHIGPAFNEFYASRLPFRLTDAQKKVIREIRRDMLTGHQMNRLLQGDVGSGKTIVALLCMLIAIDNGYQTCLMAPTEILAIQHYNTLTTYLGSELVTVALLTGSVKGAGRRKVLQELGTGLIQILVGTHALLEPSVVFNRLGFAVIDEQHRFGVQQRATLWDKGTGLPHILIMTATPIPRTLAMTLYGDLDVSVIDSLPEGRKPVETRHYFENLRLKIFGFLAKQIAVGRQVYVVYPLIEESETLDLLHLTQGFELLERTFPKPAFQISIVHGKMQAAAKDFEMQRFVKGETQIMVATTVIEVGVNVPNATVMVIENAERFGLSTLHQLRGRVGRGTEQSYCILMTGEKISKEAKTRLETMVRTNDGFQIAEADLLIRGMGDLEGLRQSGAADLKIADLSKDQDLLNVARYAAEELLARDPSLIDEENLVLSTYFQSRAEAVAWDKIS